MLRARLSLSRVIVLCSYVKILPFMGCPTFPFIGEGKARVIEEEKEKNKREKKAFRVVGSFFSFMRVLPILQMSIGMALCHGPIRHWRHA